ncbi:MAG: DegT/DnrJ/EryC1/StrS family aminotransferase [Planctomycetaceae bacterium]|nr:DegT/DnrJ/EryC1/StrS family aminotransferase [Planctomycetaceae bacterium]
MAVETLRQHAIPFFSPLLGDEEIDSVVETLRSGWLTTGPKVKRFEQLFAESVSAGHAIAVNSCTAALHLALEAIGVGPGDEVLIPTLTFASTGEVIMHLGATPVLVDCGPDFLMDVAEMESKITPRTKAVIPVHYGGHPCDMERILNVARRHGIRVIEDAAHAIPARYGDRPIGTIGDLTYFSFYANKTITTGEGGMVTTNDAELADRVRLMSLHGISKDAWKRFSAEGSWYYEITAPGYKFNMTDIAAAIGIHQLAKSERFWQRRAQIAAQYDERFAFTPEVVTPTTDLHVQNAWHLYVIRLQVEDLTISRNEFITQLNQAGIGTSVHYLPLHMHPLYRERFGYATEDLPRGADLFQRIISLPIHPRLTDEDVDFVAATVNRLVDEHHR